MGTTPGYLTIRDLEMAEGRAFTEADVDGANKVALLGKTVADTLFPGTDPVDQVVRIKNVPFYRHRRAGSQGSVAHGSGSG